MARKKSTSKDKSDQSFTTTFSVEQTPEAVFDAINDVRGWSSRNWRRERAAHPERRRPGKSSLTV